MRLVSSLSLLLASLHAISSSADPANRTEVAIEYEYQLEVNTTTGTIEGVLGYLDSTILLNLQRSLPNGQTKNDDEDEDESSDLTTSETELISEEGNLPNVLFSSITSDVFSACFTKSDQCGLIRSMITISYEGEKPEHSVEFVALALVQAFLRNFSSKNHNMMATYAYPLMVQSLAQFEMDTVSGRMSDVETQLLEDTFLEVFGAIVSAIEGDTEVVDAKFVYLDLFETERRYLSPEENKTTTEAEENKTIAEDDIMEYTLSTVMQIRGFCRDCNSPQFGDIVNGVIVDNLKAFQNQLKVNGELIDNMYFGNVTETSFAVPELPLPLPPIQDKSIFDDEPPDVESQMPWFLIFGIVMALCIMLTGLHFICQEQSVATKEEMSTSESEAEEPSYDEENYTQGDYTQDYTNGENTHGDGTYTLDEYQVETVTEADGEYEEGDYVY